MFFIHEIRLWRDYSRTHLLSLWTILSFGLAIYFVHAWNNMNLSADISRVWKKKWRPGEVGPRYCHVPFPIELQLYCQFMWSTYAVNTHKCFSVCFTVTDTSLMFAKSLRVLSFKWLINGCSRVAEWPCCVQLYLTPKLINTGCVTLIWACKWGMNHWWYARSYTQAITQIRYY